MISTVLSLIESELNFIDSIQNLIDFFVIYNQCGPITQLDRFYV